MKVEFTGSPKPTFKTKEEFLEAIQAKGFEHTTLAKADVLITDSYDSSSSKMATAKEKGIEILTYVDFLNKYLSGSAEVTKPATTTTPQAEKPTKQPEKANKSKGEKHTVSLTFIQGTYGMWNVKEMTPDDILNLAEENLDEDAFEAFCAGNTNELDLDDSIVMELSDKWDFWPKHVECVSPNEYFEDCFVSIDNGEEQCITEELQKLDQEGKIHSEVVEETIPNTTGFFLSITEGGHGLAVTAKFEIEGDFDITKLSFKSTNHKIGSFCDGEEFAYYDGKKLIWDEVDPDSSSWTEMRIYSLVPGTVITRPTVKLEFTGSPKPQFKTKEIFEKTIAALGFEHTSLKDATMLVTDSYESTSAKMETARKRGIEIITYADFIKKYNVSAEPDGLKYKTINEKEVAVVGYKKNLPSELTIPNEVEINGITYSVTEIGENAFKNCISLTSITIPDSVTRIWHYAFYDCCNLTSVTIHASIRWIDQFVFYGCTGLTSITIPASVTSIRSSAFDGCIGLTSITIPASVTKIGSHAFSGCSGLTSITIPASVTSIEGCVFDGCIGLTSITIPASVTEIKHNTFLGCIGLTSIKVEEGNSVYDSRENCNAIIETQTNTLISGCCKTTIPGSVTTIGYCAFSGCTGLTSITIPASVTSIERRAFDGRIGLTSIIVEEGNSVYDSRENCNAIVETQTNTLIRGCCKTTIPDSVTKIGEDAFEDCSGLTSITIPASVTSIGSWAFRGCSSLTNITIPDSVTEIGYLEFIGCSSLTSITLPDSVKAIWRSAFCGCKSLTNITIPASVTEIGDDAFEGCSGLTNITIPASVTNIGERAFYGCSGLTSITIPASVTKIGFCAFYGCSGLTSIKVEEGNSVYDSRENCNAIVETQTNTLISGCCKTTIPASVTKIGAYAFSDCSGLTSITIPASVKAIGGSSFSGCSGLTSIKVEEGNSVYDSRENCNAIVETKTNTLISGCCKTTIPASVTGIYGYAFSGCSSLTCITIPASVKAIDYNAFWGCIGLTSITIPSSVMEIKHTAFADCSGLTSIKVEEGNSVYDSRENCNAIVETQTNTLISGCSKTTIPASVRSIKNYAFWGCIGLTSITIPASVTEIESGAFYDCNNLVVKLQKGSFLRDSDFEGCKEVVRE